MKTKMRKYTSHKLLKGCGVILLAGLFAIGILFALEKNGITNLYTLQNQDATEVSKFPVDDEGNRLPNTVDYGPSKDEDSVPIPDKSISPVQQVVTNPDLSVIVTNSRKSGDLYLIKAVIAGTDSASCSTTMSKGTLTASASSGTTMIEGQFSCKDLSIPLSQLPESGEWTLVVTVTDKTGATASTTEKVIL